MLITGYDAIGGIVDPMTIGALKRWWFPAARIWAAANGAQGDADAVAETLPPRSQRRIQSKAAQIALRTNEDARKASLEATEAWQTIVINGGSGDPAEAETRRRRAASKHLALHGPLAAAVGRRGVVPVSWEMPTPGGPIIAADAFLAPEDLDVIQEGPVFREGGLMRRWISARAETGVAGDVAYARASWPVDGTIAGALVVGSGVGVEWDGFVRMRRDYDFANAFTEHGLAVVELVSPGHGLRRAADLYGGESFFQGAPVTAGASLAAQVRETARWIAWARRAWDRPAGVFGVSMSSFAAQLALSHAARWPEAARPDVAMLMAHSGNLLDITRGGLSRALGLPMALKGAGWTEADLKPWANALEPGVKLAISPDRIVSVTGTNDRVTPFSGGEAVRQMWSIPPRNRFTYSHGHMGLPLRALLDAAAARRLTEILNGI